MPYASCGPSPLRQPWASARLDHAIARAEAYAARCHVALGRLPASGRRTRRVRIILRLAEARLALLRSGRAWLPVGRSSL